MFALPRVVAVDNSEPELKQVRDALFLAHVPCLPVLYDAAIWPPDGLKQSCSCVRLVLMDMNLLDARSPEAKTIAPYIADVLRNIVASGPYVLIFWSNHGELADDVISILRNQYKDEVVPPMHYVVLEKHEFMLSGDAQKDEKIGKVLSEKLSKVLIETPVLEALIEWESKVTTAASLTVSRLYALAAKKDPWDGKKVQEKVSDLLTWIARETTGKQAAKEQPAEAAEQGLVYALADELARNVNSQDDAERWLKAMPKIGEHTFQQSADLSAYALNEVFHVDTGKLAKGDRGTFTFLPTEFADDAARVKKVFGTTSKALKDEFVNFEGLNGDQKAALLKACRLGLVELSAACDYAQRKRRSLRFVLAALIPSDYLQNTYFDDSLAATKRPRKHEAIYRLPHIGVKDGSYICKLNFRYILGLSEDSDLLGEALFRIRMPLLDEIAYRCSSHLARPGIISFH